jgi:hypothetical protein
MRQFAFAQVHRLYEIQGCCRRGKAFEANMPHFDDIALMRLLSESNAQVYTTIGNAIFGMIGAGILFFFIIGLVIFLFIWPFSRDFVQNWHSPRDRVACLCCSEEDLPGGHILLDLAQ